MVIGRAAASSWGADAVPPVKTFGSFEGRQERRHLVARGAAGPLRPGSAPLPSSRSCSSSRRGRWCRGSSAVAVRGRACRSCARRRSCRRLATSDTAPAISPSATNRSRRACMRARRSPDSRASVVVPDGSASSARRDLRARGGGERDGQEQRAAADGAAASSWAGHSRRSSSLTSMAASSMASAAGQSLMTSPVVLPRVGAEPCQPAGHGADREAIGRTPGRQFVPGEGRGHRRAGPGTRRVGGNGRICAVVAHDVDEDERFTTSLREGRRVACAAPPRTSDAAMSSAKARPLAHDASGSSGTTTCSAAAAGRLEPRLQARVR